MSPAEAPAGRARLRLAPGRDRPLRDGHPWVFSGAVAEERGAPDDALAEVTDAGGEALGVGLYAPGSRIRARMLTHGGGEAIDRDFFAARLGRALALRAELLPPETDGYRVVNAEGDELPGWTVDRFGQVLVSQITSPGLERLRPLVYGVLVERFPEATILHRGDLAARRSEHLPLDDELVAGGEAPEEAWFRERGLRFVAEVAGGQKTGFYCDQRDNRALAARLAAGRSLLDLFGHTGAFALYALRGGARRVVTVESSDRLLATTRRQLEANALDLGLWEGRRDDVFSVLRSESERFGVVVCDPPPLARRRADTERAARAYKDLNRLALARVEPGGYLLTFSCSAAIDRKLFRQILFAASAEAGVGVQLLAPLAAAPDHPVSVAHLEGEYLKGWLARVTGPRA